MFQSAVGDGSGLVLDLRQGQLTPGDAVVSVESTVQTSVGAEIRQVQGGIQRHGAAEVADGQVVGLLGHLLHVRLRRR